ncbi:hypothetical protein SAMN02927937_02909 [Paenimyroides aquimaris]|uniref:NAD(P)-binding domain-containing protein n=1 Tax=Paenimyroides marinum TaxID=1159016 RepID=A0A1H6MQ46_9FLAO|nr:NAD(P)H-binding protein [Paenimyroides aquimaris]SEI04015.1 hypothetical protein SAMN02927937_02909 [Paenimyroides aquimaris]
MRVIVIGGTGFVGSKIVNELADRGHLIKTIVRNADKIENKSIEFVEKDVLNDAITNDLTGADVVVSAYNAGWTNPDLYNDFLKGSRVIEQAVVNAGVKRYIVVGGAGSLFDKEGNQLVDSADFPENIKPGAVAARDYLNELKQNQALDWTFFSPAIEMHPGTSGIRKGTYRTGLDHPVVDENGRSVLSVEDVAVAIADEVEHPKHIKQRFTAAY